MYEVFPMYWWLDNTMSKVPNTSCHHCQYHEVVMQMVPTETSLSCCMGCRGCKKTWVATPGCPSSPLRDQDNDDDHKRKPEDEEESWMLSDDKEIHDEEWRFQHGLGSKTWGFNVGAPMKKCRCH